MNQKGRSNITSKRDEDPSPDSRTAAPNLADGTGVEHHRGEKEVEHYSSRRRRLRLVDAAPERKPQRNIPLAKPSSADDHRQ